MIHGHVPGTFSMVIPFRISLHFSSVDEPYSGTLIVLNLCFFFFSSVDEPYSGLDSTGRVSELKTMIYLIVALVCVWDWP